MEGMIAMTVNTQKDGTKLTVFAEGKLGTTAAPQLEKAVKNNISGVTEFVFDFGKLEYMASAGLRVLFAAAKVMKNINVTQPVMDVFTFTGMADLPDIEAV